MGIDYRVVNGYIYISGNPVTDPEKIAERAEFFQRRAGYYFENWPDLYAKWRVKVEALIEEVTNLRVPDLPEYEPDEVDVRGRPQHRVHRRARRLPAHAAPRRHDVAAALRVPAAGLRRLLDLRRLLQGAPARHSRPAHRPDGGRDRRAPVQAGRGAAPPGAAGDRDRRGRRLRRGPHARRDRCRAGEERRRASAGSSSSRRSRTPGSTWPRATASTTTTAAGSTTRASPTPRWSGTSPPCARASRSTARPRRSSASASGSPRSTARCSTPRRARASTTCSACRAWSSRTWRSTSSSATTGSSRAGGTSCASSARCWRGTATSRTRRTCSSSAATRWLRRSTSSC